MGDAEKCEKPAGHKVHMCKLRKDGKFDEIDLHEKKPIVFCNKCKAKADDPTYLCNPRALKPTK
jgi:hypothetical protein